MTKTSFHILRVGMGITFLWIGVLILKQPEAWGGYLQAWAADLLPIPIEQALIGTAILDIIVGALFIFDTLVWVVGLVAALHMVVVLTVSGITDITVRDIAILAGGLALMIDSFPNQVKVKFGFGERKG